MKNSLTKCFLVLFIVLTACEINNSKASQEILLTTHNGKQLSLNGIWTSGCIENNNKFFIERFTFSENKIEVLVTYYSDSNCTQNFENELSELEFKVDGTIEVSLIGQKLIANKVSGTIKIGEEVNPFKQVICVVENTLYETQSNRKIISFYHASFDNVEIELSPDGYPINLNTYFLFKE